MRSFTAYYLLALGCGVQIGSALTAASHGNAGWGAAAGVALIGAGLLDRFGRRP